MQAGNADAQRGILELICRGKAKAKQKAQRPTLMRPIDSTISWILLQLDSRFVSYSKVSGHVNVKLFQTWQNVPISEDKACSSIELIFR